MKGTVKFVCLWKLNALTKANPVLPVVLYPDLCPSGELGRLGR